MTSPFVLASVFAIMLCLIILLLYIVKRQAIKLVVLRSDLQAVRDSTDDIIRQKSTFIAAAAHDLRQPLQALTLFCNALDNQSLTPTSKQLSEKITRSLTSLAQLFETLFKLSNLETGISKINRSDFSLKPLLKQLYDEYDVQMTQKGIEWDCQPKDIIIRSDKLLFATIIRNLISNALRYTSHGKVSVITKQYNELVHIVIRDSGIGIEKHLQNDIFREYHQLPQLPASSVPGFGLGLSIVDRLVHMMGHQIQIKSDHGKGSEFTVIVDLGNSNAVTDSQTTSDVLKYNVDLHVLIIDDDPEILDSLQILLTSWQCKVYCASSAYQALSLFESKILPIDAIISSYHTSGNLEGFTIVQSLKLQFNIDVPVLFITGENNKTFTEVIQHNNYLSLPKPVLPAQLLCFMRSIKRKQTFSVSDDITKLIDNSIAQPIPNKGEIHLTRIIEKIILEFESKVSKLGVSLQNKCGNTTVNSNGELLATIVRRLTKLALKQSPGEIITFRCHSLPIGLKLIVHDHAKEACNTEASLLLKNMSTSLPIFDFETISYHHLGMSIVSELAASLEHKIEIEFDLKYGNQYSVLFID